MDKKFTIDGVERVISKFIKAQDRVSFEFAGRDYQFKLLRNNNGSSWVVQNCESHAVHRGAFASENKRIGGIIVYTESVACEIAPVIRSRSKQEVSVGVGSNPIAPLTGVIREVAVVVGEVITAHQTVATIEAMKMQMAIVAPKAGVVKEVCVIVGEQVTEGKIVIVVDVQ